jgi:hypothetical protein
MNFRDRYEFEPETYTGEGGLSGMLRAAIQQYGADPGPAANVGPGSASDGSANAQGDLLGRLLSLQAEQNRYRPVSDSPGRPPLAIQSSNRSQPLQAPKVIQPLGAIGSSNLPNDQPNYNYSPLGDGATLDLLRTSQMQHDRYQPSAVDERVSQRRLLAQSIMDVSHRLGISPEDLATAISYETAGTFDPWKAGPVTQHGQHRGLIQWGEPQAKYYGVTKDSSIPAQMEAVGRYLIDSGVTSESKLLDIYSAINAGRVGRDNKSDANNGGATGTVADKVAGMGDHRLKAARLLAQYAPTAFPTAPEKPVRVLSRRIAGEPRSFDGDETRAQAWDVPSPMFDPRR